MPSCIILALLHNPSFYNTHIIHYSLSLFYIQITFYSNSLCNLSYTYHHPLICKSDIHLDIFVYSYYFLTSYYSLLII